MGKVCRQTVVKWVQQHIRNLPVLSDTLALYEIGDVLELDENSHLLETRNTNDGFGLPYVGVLARLLPIALENEIN